MTEQEFSRLMAKARKRVAAFDEVDGGQPLLLSIALDDACTAVERGLRAGDLSAIADGLVMLERATKCARREE